MGIVDIIKKGLSSFQIKIIAVVIMTIDHLAAYQILTTDNHTNSIMRMIGRIAAPLFLFLLVEGLHYTRSKTKYVTRLYIFSFSFQFIIEILTMIFTKQGNAFLAGNIFQTFFYTALYITCIEKIIKKDKNIIAPAVFMFIPLALVVVHQWFSGLNYSGNVYEFIKIILNVFCPSPFTIEYSFIFVILGVLWYFVNNKYINCALFIVLSLFSYAVDVNVFYNPNSDLSFWHLFTSPQWYMVFAVIFILLYNGKKGKYGLKYFFYIYYPVHMILFLIITTYILHRWK